MPVTNSPNMSLPIPVTGSESGPTYANDINSSLTIIDGHDHSAGSGVQITPAGLNINSSLPLNNNSLTLTKSVSFQAQLSSPGSAQIFVIGVDLYYTDGNGNVIRITQSGSVAGASGTITGLPSGTASASYGGGTFTFQAATNTPANIVGASFILGNNLANTKTLTLQPPNAMGSNYSLTLPAIPAQTNVMTLDTSGNMGSVTFDAVGQTMTSVGANAIAATMTSTGANAIGSTMTSTGANAVANTRTRAHGSSTEGVGGVASLAVGGSTGSNSPILLGSVTLTTSGRPVVVQVIPNGSSDAYFGFDATNGGSNIIGPFFPQATFYIQSSSSGVLGKTIVAFSGNVSGYNYGTDYGIKAPANISAIDFVAAGTYTYSFYYLQETPTYPCNAFATNCLLIAYEL